jgi:hypothetical protein
MNPDPALDIETIVRSLLALSGVRPPEDEIQRYIDRYPTIRDSLAALHTLEVPPDTPGILTFRSGDT